jgi:hypothetical protein
MTVQGGWISLKRALSFMLAFYLTVNLVCTEPVLDWNDHWDPKFDKALYGDLEDGGDEGGDDD